MLIVSRKIGESITIGTEITITISDIKGAYVKLAIDAPRERYEVVRQENLSLSGLSTTNHVGRHFRQAQQEKAMKRAQKNRQR